MGDGIKGAGMSQTEIDAVRALLSAKPRPVGWEERRRRIEEVGATWPIAADVKLEPVDLGGVNANGRSFPALTAPACCSTFMAAVIAPVRL